jgi:hypothetical protein
MATHAQIAASLLRDAAAFFRNVGDQNPPIQEQMERNASAFEHVAELVETDPTKELTLSSEEE